jgi:hypothetical protein
MSSSRKAMRTNTITTEFTLARSDGLFNAIAGNCDSILFNNSSTVEFLQYEGDHIIATYYFHCMPAAEMSI